MDFIIFFKKKQEIRQTWSICDDRICDIYIFFIHISLQSCDILQFLSVLYTSTSPLSFVSNHIYKYTFTWDSDLLLFFSSTFIYLVIYSIYLLCLIGYTVNRCIVARSTCIKQGVHSKYVCIWVKKIVCVITQPLSVCECMNIHIMCWSYIWPVCDWWNLRLLHINHSTGQQLRRTQSAWRRKCAAHYIYYLS